MRVVEAPIVCNARGQPSVGPALSRDTSPRVALRSWGLVCPLGDDVTSIWDSLLDGRFITDNAKSGQTALQLARSVAAALTTDGIEPGAALVIGTSKGSVENWLDAGADV